MSDGPHVWNLQRVIVSDGAAAQAVLDEILSELRARQWPASDLFAVHLAVHEALTNAVVHGNRRDPNKKVTVACRLLPDELAVTIGDEGPGFDPHQLPDCTQPDRLDAPGGRGVALMRSFMDRVTFSDQGRTVHLTKRRTTAPGGQV